MGGSLVSHQAVVVGCCRFQKMSDRYSSLRPPRRLDRSTRGHAAAMLDCPMEATAVESLDLLDQIDALDRRD
jgi:hypothetical protein